MPNIQRYTAIKSSVRENNKTLMCFTEVSSSNFFYVYNIGKYWMVSFKKIVLQSNIFAIWNRNITKPIILLSSKYLLSNIWTHWALFYAPPPESGGVLCYTLRNFECPSVCPSVRPSAPTTILVSATPPTVLGQSFWNFTGVLRMVWRYAYCFFRILKLFFITFFPFLT